MKLTLSDPKYLRETISIISELVNETNLKVTPDGIELVAMDPANVSMAILKILSSSFVEYDVDKEVNIAINLNSLKQILKRSKPNEILTLELGKEGKLKITLKGTNTRTFSLPIIDTEEKEQKIPSLEFPLVIETDSSLVDEAVEDVGLVSESVVLVAEPKRFMIEGSGDTSDAKIEISQGEGTKIKMEGTDGKIAAKYSIEYMKKIIKGSKLSDKVEIRFNKDYPLKITYKEVDKFMLSFILAPRVETD